MTKSKLPQPGEVFALRVAASSEIALRVLDVREGAACVVMTTWSAKGPLPKTFTLQAFDHHNWDRPLLGGWVQTRAPAELRSLGLVPVRPAERARVLHPKLWLAMPKKNAAMSKRVLPIASWDGLLIDARAQWRWLHERAAVLAEDARAEALSQSKLFAAAAAQQTQRERLVASGVEGLQKKRFFAAWSGSVPKAMQLAAERLLRSAVTPGRELSKPQWIRRLSALVEAFNALDGSHGHDFSTPDTEDIMEAVALVATACGIDDATFDAEIDAVREF